jgi:hypothetical protein
MSTHSSSTNVSPKFETRAAGGPLCSRLARASVALGLMPSEPEADLGEHADFTRLDDPEFLRERRHVRERLESLPEHHADRAALARLYDAMTEEFTRRAARMEGIVNSITMSGLGFANSGPGGLLPRRTEDRAPRTPSAAARRNRFARRHPEVPISVRREGTRLVFDVAEPGGETRAYQDADAMMDDLEARYP